MLILYSLHIQAQDVRLLKTKVADILMQMPAKNADHLNSLLEQIIILGDEGLTEITGLLKAPGEGDDIQVRFALTSLARHSSQKGHDKEWDWLQNNFLKAIETYHQ